MPFLALSLVLFFYELLGPPLTPYARNAPWELTLGNANYLGTLIGLSLIALPIVYHPIVLGVVLSIGTRSILVGYLLWLGYRLLAKPKAMLVTKVLPKVKAKPRLWLALVLSLSLVLALVLMKPDSTFARANIYWDGIRAIGFWPNSAPVEAILTQPPPTGMRWAHLESDVLLAIVRLGLGLSAILTYIFWPLLRPRSTLAYWLAASTLCLQSTTMVMWLAALVVWPYRSRLVRMFAWTAFGLWWWWHLSCVMGVDLMSRVCRLW
jgi:hypothetical protein